MSEKQELIAKMLEMQKKFMDYEHANGVEMEDYFVGEVHAEERVVHRFGGRLRFGVALAGQRGLQCEEVGVRVTRQASCQRRNASSAEVEPCWPHSSRIARAASRTEKPGSRSVSTFPLSTWTLR